MYQSLLLHSQSIFFFIIVLNTLFFEMEKVTSFVYSLFPTWQPPTPPAPAPAPVPAEPAAEANPDPVPPPQ